MQPCETVHKQRGACKSRHKEKRQSTGVTKIREKVEKDVEEKKGYPLTQNDWSEQETLGFSIIYIFQFFMSILSYMR